MPAQPPPSGVYVPVPTFFVPRTSQSYNRLAPPLSPETQAKHTLHLARSGITGLVLLGSTGEAIHLSNSERKSLLSDTRKTLNDAGFPAYPLIAGTATQNIEECITQLRDAKEAGCQWGLVLVPGFFAGAVSQAGIEKWFEAVADESPIPILIYHYPGVSNNVKLLPSTMLRLAEHPNIVGCKLSHGDISHHAQIACSSKLISSNSATAPGFATFTGLGQQLLPILALGCAGTIDGTAGFFPKSVVHLYKLCTAPSQTKETKTEARALQGKLSAVEELVVKFGTVGIKEAVSRILGLGDRDGTRLPLEGGIPGGDEEWARWEGVVGAFAEVEKGL